MEKTMGNVARYLAAGAAAGILGLVVCAIPAFSQTAQAKSEPANTAADGNATGAVQPGGPVNVAVPAQSKPPENNPAGASAPAQPGAKDAKALPGLEDMLAAALEYNPDIVVARAKVREAEAVLNQTRLAVMRQVVALRQKVELQSERTALLRQRHATGRATREDVVNEMAALADLESQMQYLLGHQPQGAGETRQPFAVDQAGPAKSVPPAMPQSAMADKLREALDQVIEVNFDQAPLADVVAYLKDRTKINFVLDRAAFDDMAIGVDTPTTCNFTDVPLGAVLQSLEDTTKYVRFVIRDYGVLVTTDQGAPKGAVFVRDFWTSNPKSSQPRSGDGPRR
ncbi:MAG: hypothetical protein ACYC35_20635 [Pirellulales bacterium]